MEPTVVHKMNSTGPNSEPHGTPNMRGEEKEAELLTTTHWFLSKKYDWNHCSVVEQMPKTVLRPERIWWLIVSAAAERSSKSRRKILSLSLVFCKSFTMHRRVVLLLYPVQWADRKGLQRFSWRCARSLCRVTFSRILGKNGKFETAH